MAYQSAIEWTETTWNPVTGCTKISAGCKFCYAERFAERFRGVPGHPYEQGFDLRLHSKRLDLPLSWSTPRLIFVNSMSDLFHEAVPVAYIEQVFRVMRSASQHTFQVLTKRADRMGDLCNERIVVPDNVWIGVSVENQAQVGRIDHLKRVRAATRFLSCEPLLGPLKLDLGGIHWVIVGGESGPKSRPMKADWVKEIREHCLSSRVPFFFKQWGGIHKKKTGRLLDGRTWDEMPPSRDATRVLTLA